MCKTAWWLSQGSARLKERISDNGASSSFFICLLLLPILLILSCSNLRNDSGPFHVEDEALLPYAAMHRVDRERICLTEIDKDSSVRLQKSDSLARGYDMAVHVASDGVSRTVFFAWESDQYVWIGEQETHYSGQYYESPDGEQPERITITYYERKTQGGLEGLSLMYWGDDARVLSESKLTCDLALAYIEEWAVKEK